MDGILGSLLTIVAAIIPAGVWLFFFTKEDVHPEPKKLILYVFEIGALASLPALAAQLIFQKTILYFGFNIIFLIIGLALIEEICKWYAAYWAINKHSVFDEPIDAMVYMIAAAAGFATIENLFIAASFTKSFNLISWVDTGNVLVLRFIGATLLHTLSSALVGYYWAMGKIKGKSLISWGIFAATMVHSMFNYLILQYQNETLMYPSLFLIIATFFILNDFEKIKVASSEITTNPVIIK